MWCWHVIVNRQSADGYDYHKLYGTPPPAEQTIRTTSLKKGFIDQDLWRQGHSKSGTQRFFMKYRKVPCSWKMRLPCDAHFSRVENLLMFCRAWCVCPVVSCSLIEECSLWCIFLSSVERWHHINWHVKVTLCKHCKEVFRWNSNPWAFANKRTVMQADLQQLRSMFGW